MAIYHLEAQIIGRTDGRSAIACAAYRSGEAITDVRTGTAHKHGDADRVAHTEIVAPVGAPDWTTDRSQLWNRVEAGEKRKNSQLSREFEIALPNELTLDQQRTLLRGWVQAELTPHGVIADIAIHIEPKKNRAARRSDHAKAKKARNDHAHIMTTMRALADDGEGFGDKLRNLNWNGTIERWRASWQEHANAALELAGSEARIDHRSNEARGLGIAMIKEGPGARRRQVSGRTSDRVDFNDTVRMQRSLTASLGDAITDHLHHLAETAKRKKLTNQRKAEAAKAAIGATKAATSTNPPGSLYDLAASVSAERTTPATPISYRPVKVPESQRPHDLSLAARFLAKISGRWGK